jgi:hypothetical protein
MRTPQLNNPNTDTAFQEMAAEMHSSQLLSAGQTALFAVNVL